MDPLRILFCASEIYPLIKTGGLADVAGSLPKALSKLGHDVRLILPGYRSVLARLKRPPKVVLQTRIYKQSVTLSQTTLPGSRLPLWLVECPELYDRPGGPYLQPNNQPWPDNALRFAVFSKIIANLAIDEYQLGWQPNLVHCNDWHTGLVPVYLYSETKAPATIFTIHNLAYQGVFDHATFNQLQIPNYFWHYERLEFHGQFSFLKGGLVFSDRINTVSPHYAKEIQTAQFGHGMETVLHYHKDRVSGILNGIDTQTWNPGTDTYIAHKYNRQHLEAKTTNKLALQKRFGLPQSKKTLLLGVISRLVAQKGIDLILAVLPDVMQRDIQLVVLGSGEQEFEKQLNDAQQRWPNNVGLHLGYDEALAHLVEAGSDAFIMPSRFEPCGLNQLYSQRYGTLPIVTPVGGLFDTVVDADEASLAQRQATGFVLSSNTEYALLGAIDRALALYHQPAVWQSIMLTAMSLDFSWQKSAMAYLNLYQSSIRHHASVTNEV